MSHLVESPTTPPSAPQPPAPSHDPLSPAVTMWLDASSSRQAPALAMRLLAAGVPLSLLMDLADPLGPDSLGIMANEREPRRARVVDLREKAVEVAS